MKIIKKIFILIAIAICILLLSENKVYAITQEEAGQCIANNAMNFYKQHANDVEYNANGVRYYQSYNGPGPDGIYRMECVGFVCMVIHNALGIETLFNEGSLAIIAPGDAGDEFEEVTGQELKPGDVVSVGHWRSGGHVGIYVGVIDGKPMVIHHSGTPLNFQPYDEYYRSASGSGWTQAYRLKQYKCDEISKEQCNNGGDSYNFGSGGIGGAIGSAIEGLKNRILGWFGKLIGENEEFPKGEPLSDEEYKKLYYKGVAEQVNDLNNEIDDEQKAIREKEDGWTFPSISKIIDWIISGMTMAVRGVFVGWANIIQYLASMWVADASGETSNINVDKGIMENFSQQMKDSLTIEKIVYNKVPLFDINVFSDESAKAGSLTATIRNLTANWYYIVRLVSIIALLLVLIYMGIKAAVSSVAEDKATFKKMIVNWLVAFIIVFFMQYFMMIIIQINQSLINIFAKIGSQLNLYEEIRRLTWSENAAIGLMSALLYIALVWYLIKFIVIYFKRLFVTILLIVIAPFIGAKYAYDKIKGEKGGASLGKWGKEFTFSVMMQTIHALIYTIFVTIVLTMTVSPVKADSITTEAGIVFAKLILAFLFFRFMTQGEKILRDIFKLSGSKGGTDVGNVDSSIGDLAGASFMYNKLKPYTTPMIDFSKRMLLGKINRGIGENPGIIRRGYIGVMKKMENAYVNQNRKIMGLGKSQEGNLTDEKIDNALREEYHMKTATARSVISTGGRAIQGMAQSFAAIPIFMTESPLMGIEWMYLGVNTVLHAAGEPIKGYKKFEKQRKYKSSSKVFKTMAGIATAGATSIYSNVRDVYGQKLDIIYKHKPEELKVLIEAQMVENRLKRNLEALQFTEFKGFNVEGSSQLEHNLASSYEEKLLTAINDSQKTFGTNVIMKNIKEYEAKNGNYSLSIKDLTQISKKLEVKDEENPENDIRFTNKLENNIKEEVKQKIVNNIVNQDDETVTDKENSNVRLTKSSYDELATNINNMYTNLQNEKKQKNNESNETKKYAAHIAMLVIEQDKLDKYNEELNVEVDYDDNSNKNNSKEKSKDLIDIIQEERQKNENKPSNERKEENSTYEKISAKEFVNRVYEGKVDRIDISVLKNEDRQEVENAIKNSISNKMVNDTLTNLNTTELTDVLKKSIDKDGSIQKERVSTKFRDVVEDAQKLAELNNKMIDMTSVKVDDDGNIVEKKGEAIYSKDELIELIRKSIRTKD